MHQCSRQLGKYTYFYIHEPKLRRVAAALSRDRVVHHTLVCMMEPIFEKKFMKESDACRKGTCAGVPQASVIKSCCGAAAGPLRVGR